MKFIIVWYLVYLVLCASWFAWFSLALINVLAWLVLEFYWPWRFVISDELLRGSTGSAGHSSVNQLISTISKCQTFLWLEHAFEWSSGYFIHCFDICCVLWFWVRFRCQTYILTFKEEVKYDIDEGVRVSSLMISVGIIS